MTVAIYCRLSPKPGGGYEGVDDQTTWGMAYAAKHWPGEPVEVFADRGKSAGRDDVVRPDFDRLREWINAGKITRLWTVEQSRLTRREIVWFEFAADLDAAGITEVHTNRDGIVRVSDEVAGIKAVLAASERRKMLRRLNDTLTEKAAKGEPPGGNVYGYDRGFLPDGKHLASRCPGASCKGCATKTYLVVPEEAAEIKTAADKILAGWSLASIVKDLNARGLRGSLGGKITSGGVKGWLTAPSIAGQRVHSGEVVGQGNWEPILDMTTFKAVGAKLTGPRQVRRTDGQLYPVGTAHRGAPGRRYLLTGGLAVCGVCGAPLIGTEKQRQRGPRGARETYTKPYLLCHPKIGGGRACVGVILPEVEAYVIDELFTRLDSAEFRDALADDDYEAERARLVTALTGIDGQRRELAAMWGRRELTTTEWSAAKAELDEQERSMSAALTAIPAASSDVSGAEAREDWEELTLDERRAFLRRYIESVTILRARPKGHAGLDTDRVRIEWRTPSGGRR